MRASKRYNSGGIAVDGKHYTLTLTLDERRALDWIGGRYRHGDELINILCESVWSRKPNPIIHDDDLDWEGNHDITFSIPERLAWTIPDIVHQDGLACLSDELVKKIVDLMERIV
jgi:hypothetical protein